METSTNQPPLPPNPTETGFPILAIAVLCIMATAFLLVSYYIFLTKCCLNMQQLDPLRRFSISRARRHNHDSLMPFSPSLQTHGLNELLIREIPTFLYNKGEFGERSLRRCVVCLCEFQEQDMLRILPNCGHGFHLDCIDIWLQSNDNCPLCRSSISGTTRLPIDRLVAPASSPQDPHPFLDHTQVGDDDFVVIELSERTERRESSVFHQNRVFSPRKLEKKSGKMMKLRKTHHFSIMGDECIDVRDKDEQFSIQPIRRSFSMDSAADRHVYLAVQDIIIQNRARTEEEEHVNDIRNNEESSSSSSSSRGRRLFFPFGHGRGSRSSVLPL